MGQLLADKLPGSLDSSEKALGLPWARETGGGGGRGRGGGPPGAPRRATAATARSPTLAPLHTLTLNASPAQANPLLGIPVQRLRR